MTKSPAIIPVFLPYLGCGERCVYCNQMLLTEQSTVMTPGEVASFVKKALDTLDRKKFKEADVALYGGTFTELPLSGQEQYLRALTPFVHSGKVRQLRLSTRPDRLNETHIDFLITHKVGFVEIGVQSFDDEVLSLSGRSYRSAQAAQVCELVKTKGIKLGIHLMLGLPGDTKETSVTSAHTAAALNPDLVRLHPTIVLQDTELARIYKNGMFRPWSVEAMIETLCEIVEFFEKKQIQIGRIGLQPTDAMRRPGAIVAGGELLNIRDRCMSRIFLRKMNAVIPAHNGTLTIKVHPNDLSHALGYKKENLKLLKNAFPDLTVQIRPNGKEAREGSVICSETDRECVRKE